MKIIEQDVHYVVVKTQDPEKELSLRQGYPHECSEESTYVQLWDINGEGNLKERLRLHVGHRYAVPCPSEEYLDTLVDEYRKEMEAGAVFYQLILKDYRYYQEYEDPNEPTAPDYDYVDEVKDAWMTVDEVAEEKDVDKSTVTRAIYKGIITAVFSEDENRRYVLPDEDYEAWSPDRRRGYLRDRRLMMAKEVLEIQSPRSLDSFYAMLEATEANRFGGAQLPEDGSVEKFLEGILPEEEMPATLSEWQDSIDSLMESYGLNAVKKFPRAFRPETIELAKEILALRRSDREIEEHGEHRMAKVVTGSPEEEAPEAGEIRPPSPEAPTMRLVDTGPSADDAPDDEESDAQPLRRAA